MKKKIFIIQIGICFLIVGCHKTDVIDSKEQFITRYNEFMKKVRTEYKQYKIEDWTKARNKYNQLINECPKYKFTASEDSVIAKQSREYWHLELIFIDGFAKGLNKFVKSLPPSNRKRV